MIAQAFAALGFGALLYAFTARLRAPAGLDLADASGFYAPADEAPAALQWINFTARPTLGVAAGNVPTVWTWPARAEPYRETIVRAADAQAIPADLLARVLQQESAYRPDVIDGRTRSTAGALGIAQFMPATARQFGIDPTDPAQAIPAAATYLRQLFDRFGSWTLALAAYNWGQGNVARRGIDAAPVETRAYVADVLRDVPL